jgi:SAM-dependent methyltransferase
MDYKDFLQLQKQTDSLHFWYKARKILIFNLLNSIFKKYKKDRLILNIGCGTGTELEILKKFGQTVALDNNQNAIEIVKKQKYKTILIDVEKYNFQNNYYDAICCFDLLEHLQNDHIVINNIFQSLKQNGYFFFTIPAFQFLFSSHDVAMEHYRRYNKKNILDKLFKAGFKIIKLNYWNSFLFPIIFIVRIIKKILFIFFFKKIKHQSEMKNFNKHLNKLLFLILNLENKFIFYNLPIPFGLTIYGIAKK